MVAVLHRWPARVASALVAMLFIALALPRTGIGQTPPADIQLSDGPIPVRVLLQSPADTDTDLQIICLFSSDPANPLRGALAELNSRLHGLLDRLRTPMLFRGDLGETLLMTPNPGAIKARKLMLIGLGPSATFTPDRMEQVGSIVYREASRLGAAHPFFAPTVRDGGVAKYTTGQISEQIMRGILRAIATRTALRQATSSTGGNLQDLTYLAGTKYAARPATASRNHSRPPSKYRRYNSRYHARPVALSSAPRSLRRGRHLPAPTADRRAALPLPPVTL